MKTSTLSFTAALVVFTGFCAFAGIEASGAPEPTPQLQERQVKRTADESAVNDAPIAPDLMNLAQYTADVMGSWPQAIIQEADENEIAYDIARAVLRKPSSDPHQDAVLLAALAFWEGARFAEYVDSGECNDSEWRKTGFDVGPQHRPRERGGAIAPLTPIWLASELMHVGGDCDGSRAHSLWQIWPATDPSSPRYTFCKLDVITGDRSDAAFCALLIARADPSLCAYTGEKPATGCDKAELRFQFTLKALAEHPFPKLVRE